MQRKLVQQGNGALTLTLPAKWLKRKGLKAGDELTIIEGNDVLRLQKGARTAKSSTTLDLKGSERSAIWHQVQARYIQGYDEITINHDNAKVMHDVSTALTGMVVTHETKNSLTLSSLISVPEQSFEPILRRTAHILDELARLLPLVVRGESNLKEMKEYEKRLDNNILYCLRYLNKYVTTEHAYQHFMVALTFELAGDELTRIAEHIGDDEELAQIVRKGIERFTSAIFKKDFDALYKYTRRMRSKMQMQTFAQGLAYSLAELLYNYAGFIVGE